MTGRSMRVALAALATLALAAACTPEPGKPAASFESEIAALTPAEGFLTVYPDPEKGRVLLALPAPDPETRVALRAIHVAYLRTGLGSNPVGLDRGASGAPRVVAFEVRGPKVFLVAENTRFVADTDDPLEREAVEESFARSVLWSGDVVATAEDGRILVDLSSFLTSDALGVARALDAAGQGSYALDANRSAADPAASLVFPDNIELEAFLTFSASEPGAEVAATAADGTAPTFTVHHSFVRLPEDGFRRRAFDPRIGVIGFPVADYAAGLDEPVERVTALRFRLEKTDPSAERSPVKKPIVFYVDRGAPEPIREALLDGAGWWAEAFEAAGFEDAYRVELLPEGAHPLDARYNVIQWVHRQTRGWSYGSPIYDPRTGEILKAVITLGSLRVRHDRMIFEGLLDAKKTGTGAPDDPVQLALARIRQLAAHEVGHGLGFPHNMAGSFNDRASVMDYPAPRVRVSEEDEIDVSDAYDAGLGAWDVASARYLYTELPEGADEKAGLDAIVAEARAAGLVFVTDGDARPLSGANPTGALWDDGADPVAGLETALEVRRLALADFGVDNIAPGTAVSELAEVLAPVHLWHRYAVEAAAKLVGGYRYAYAVAGDAEPQAVPVPVAEQRRALAALLAAVDADELTLPAGLPELIAPRHESWFDAPSREAIAGTTGPVFDEQASAVLAAGLVFDALLDPARASRLAAASGDGALTLEAMIEAVSSRVITELAARDPRVQANARAIAERWVTGLVDLAASDAISRATATRVESQLTSFAGFIEYSGGADDSLLPMAARIRRFLERPSEAAAPAEAPAAPPGAPIGSAMWRMESEWHE